MSIFRIAKRSQLRERKCVLCQKVKKIRFFSRFKDHCKVCEPLKNFIDGSKSEAA